ncbi:hypothetical protein HR12_19320 [Microbacterium sp. SUBG005]|nr:hypothetical protein HR12_19320 [Microbacterium sp. SUBG005]
MGWGSVDPEVPVTDHPAPLLTPARVLAATGVVAVIAALTLAPRAIAWPARSLALDVLERLPSAWTEVLFGGGIDVTLNVGFFIPLGAAVALLLPLRWAPASVAMGGGRVGHGRDRPDRHPRTRARSGRCRGQHRGRADRDRRRRRGEAARAR